MKRLIWNCLVAFLLSLKLFAQDPEVLRKDRDALVKRGMWRDAVSFYEENLLLVSDKGSGNDLDQAAQAIEKLQAWDEVDRLVERAVSAHPVNPTLRRYAAMIYHRIPHSGRIIAGDFIRDGGYRYGGGRLAPGLNPEASAGMMVDTRYRDKIRIWQLLREALAQATDDVERFEIWNTFAWDFVGEEVWKLQTRTPLDRLPEWGEPGPEGGTEGAPWAKDGPVLYAIPASWEAAKNDGERWRFSLAEKVRLRPDLAGMVTLELADFSRSQFGTETLAAQGWWRPADADNAKGILELETLGEDECLAKTSEGIRRFKLPPAWHFIALYRSIMDRNPNVGDILVQVYLNRRQYDKAREVLEQTIAKHGVTPDGSRRKLLQQITGHWGRFEAAAPVAAGIRPSLPLIFRNASKINLTASPVDMEAILSDSMAHLKKDLALIDPERMNPSLILLRLIKENQSKYVGEIVTKWEVPLTPREKHRDTRVDLEIPLEKAGAWWVSGQMENGNLFYTIVWIVDSVLVQNDVGGKKQWWVADAASGAPVEGSTIDFFGYRIVNLPKSKSEDPKMKILTKEFTRVTDADGKTLLKPGDWDEEFQWLTIARKEGRAAAFFGFQPYSIAAAQSENGNRDLSYGISDRPIYKPGDTAHLKFYFRNVGYFDPDEQAFANQVGTLVLSNGRGEEVVKLQNLRTDSLGAVECEVVIPKDAVLGEWSAGFRIGDRIGSSVGFRVEEYRKPEYEVKVEAPTDPVKLGDSFTAIVSANYFHGTPVREADVEVIVKRSSISERWFPAWRWDWLYGPGAWWSGAEASWHPTWDRWSCIPPHPPWWQGQRWTPDEIVLKRKLPIGPDGTLKIEIDTASAKATHGNIDAKYTITARVVDASHREESATGSVIAARKPFEVVVWTDRGYTRAGEAVQANISAANLAGKPVVGATGKLTLFKLSRGEGGRIEEQEIESFPIETDADGQVHPRIAAPVTGQYRLAASLSFKGGEPAEGATVLNVHGSGRTEPADWHFGPLEIIADKPSYLPGETAKLRINSDRNHANVWLFLHISGSAAREARRIRLDGKSLEVEVSLDARDLPNMFVEGVTVHGAKVHSAVRQILLPPVSKLIEVTVEPAKARVKPRETSALRVTLRDAEGKPVTGTAVLAVYDKALEAITGGSNIGAIHENFWSWKNHYALRDISDSIPNPPGNLLRPKAIGMESLGCFGDEEKEFSKRGLGGAGFQSKMMSRRALAEGAVMMMADRGPMDGVMAGAAHGGANPIVVRKDFADLLKWSGAIRTDAGGHAEIPLDFPDNLTTWKARVWVLGKGTQVGEGSAEVITSKELLVRLQAPRFLVEGDESVIGAIVQNDHDEPAIVKVSLELDGRTLEAIDGAAQTVEIKARSEARVDWRVKARQEGEATLRMRADSGDDGDAFERKLPVLVRGLSRQDAWSRVVAAGAESAKILIDVPGQRRPEQSKLSIRFSPTIAGAVVDAIPYLATYPHGCTEQTLNRFVPTVIARQMLRDLNISLAEVRAKRTNLNPQELGNAADRSAQWKQWQTNPVFDEFKIEQMVAEGIRKLVSMQNSDGGWGWFSGYGEVSYPHTTAVIIHGLLVARRNGARIPDAMLASGIEWLTAYERKQVAALQLHVEREVLRKEGRKIKDPDRYDKHRSDAVDAFVRLVLGESERDSEPMLAFLYRDRLDLPVYAKCLLALEQHRKGDESRRDELVILISQFLKRDPENQTVFLDIRNASDWWNWYGSEVETHAWYLKLLTAVKPMDADTRGLVKYLVNHRKHASYWESTRDTAFAVEAIAAYFKASGEEVPEMEVDVRLDGKSLRKVVINRENLFTFDGTLLLEGDAVKTGRHEIELVKTGRGTLYSNVYLEVFTLEDKLRAAGLEVKVGRRVSKWVALEKPAEVPGSSGLIAEQQVERFRREPLAEGAVLAVGDRVEVELIVESKNDYEYLIVSDAKAAGFEALDALSGYVSGGGFSVYREAREQTMDFFIRALPRGTSTLRYQLRAEASGTYRAMPATVEGMYAPELKGNSEDFRLEISN